MLTYFFIHVTYQFVFSFFRKKQVDLSYPDELQKLQQYLAHIPQINTIIIKEAADFWFKTRL